MTIVEQVIAPVVVTERERRARVLEAAALEIDVRGWTRGFACDQEGRVCAGGAIALALGFDVHEELLGNLWVSVHSTYGTDSELVPCWNDDSFYGAESAEDVKFLLRWRAEEIRDDR